MSLFGLVDGGAIVRYQDFDEQPTLAPNKPQWLPVVDTQPAFDPTVQSQDGPTITVSGGQISRVWTNRDKNADELAAMKAAKAAALQSEFASRTYLPITYGTNQFETDETARKRVNAAIQLMQAGKLPSPLQWAIYQSTTMVNMTTDDMLNLAAAVAVREQQLILKCFSLEAQLAALTTAADVNAFDPTAGWS